MNVPVATETPPESPPATSQPSSQPSTNPETQSPAPPPSTSSPAPSGTPTPATSRNDNGDVIAAINAMPERITNALREALQPAKPAETPPPATSTPNEPGKPKSFSEWWFSG